LPGTTGETKLNQGFSRRLGVISGGGLFWVPFWASKKVQSIKKQQCMHDSDILIESTTDKYVAL
jgi:hypothetical protein